ncbi:hypothetical protein [Rhodopila sp.]|uniref:hypothetical protein n=1 Tax=Rhodopila sp. TaxID=2480087 RepID=UPI002BF649C3|nr:hypothetical protein [Rhodopila sp.]HVZ09333.1 hypothetical protein [Rhodopila sp.]
MGEISIDEPEVPEQEETAGSEITAEHDRQLDAMKQSFEGRLVTALMKAEAVRAGMIDLDGLKLADLSGVTLGPSDELVGAREAMDNLRRSKPWLFGSSTSSSSPAVAPASHPRKQRSALEMSDEEYAAARAALISRRI